MNSLPSFKALPWRWILLCVLMLVLAAAVFYGGMRWERGGWLQREVTTAQRRADAETAARLQYEQQTGELNRVSNDYETAKAKLAETAQQLARAEKLAIAAKPPKLPTTVAGGDRAGGVLSVDGMRYYNAAFGYDDASAVASESANATAEAGAIDSGVSRADLLAHVRDVGYWCQSVGAQRDGLLRAWDATEAAP